MELTVVPSLVWVIICCHVFTSRIASILEMDDNRPHSAFPTPIPSPYSGLLPGSPLYPGHLMTSYPAHPGPAPYPFPAAGHLLPLQRFYPMPSPLPIKPDLDNPLLGFPQHPVLSSQMGYLPAFPPGFLPSANPDLLSPVSAVSDAQSVLSNPSALSDPSVSEPDCSTDKSLQLSVGVKQQVIYFVLLLLWWHTYCHSGLITILVFN